MPVGLLPIPAQPSPPLNLAHLQLWRAQPKPSTLHDRIPPSKEQSPIIMTAMRVSGRKFVTGIWLVSNGEAFFVSFYDPKAVVTLELTILCGWWAELGLPPVTAMTAKDLQGLALYLMQGISVQIPKPDRKGRVDMAKATLHFDLGPPPPRSEIDCQSTNRKKNEGRGCVPDQARRAMLWKGFRRFGRRPVLLSFTLDGPSAMIVRGWDSSMAWRMTNVITFHEVDWRQWVKPRSAGSKRPLPVSLDTKVDADNADTHCNTGPDSSDGSHGRVIARRSQCQHWETSSLRNIDHLCQAIANRVKIRREGTLGGKIALRPPRRAGVDHHRGTKTEVGKGGGGDGVVEDRSECRDLDSEIILGDGKRSGRNGAGIFENLSGSIGGDKESRNLRPYFLSHKDMEQRVKELDSKERCPNVEDESFTPDSSLEDDKKTRGMEEAVEQLLKAAKVQKGIQMIRRKKVVENWKWVGRALCRLLRMTDFWIRFAADQMLSDKERAARRISVLREIVQVHGIILGRGGWGGGYTTTRTILRALMKRYPRSIWTKFRQLMRQPKAQRCRRDMSVCAMLMSDIDNLFFRCITVDWPITRLIDLATDARLVLKSPLSALYDEGEAASKLVRNERCSTANTGGGRINLRNRVGSVKRARIASKGEDRVPDSEANGGARVGMGVNNEKGLEDEKGTVGAFVILRGSVDLYVLERGPTAGLQQEFALKTSRGHEESCRVERDSLVEKKAALDETDSYQGDVHGAQKENRTAGQVPRLAVAKESEAFSESRTPDARRDFAPRWRACRLGPGALFGDRTGSTDEHQEYQPALETAVTTETTELLEIGLRTYRELLAVGARERVSGAVAVLRATRVLDDVPTPDLERICRYATDHTIFSKTDLKHPPLMFNPGAGPKPSHRQYGHAQKAVCRQGTFQTTAFFVAEGSGEVILGDRRSSSSASPVRDNLFRTSRKRRRPITRLKEGIKRSTSTCKYGGNPSEQDGPRFYVYPTVQEASQSTATTEAKMNEYTASVAEESNHGTLESAVVTKASSSVSSSRLESTANWSSGSGEEGQTKPVAILQRGDFFGIAPINRSTELQQELLSLSTVDAIGENGSVKVHGTSACSLSTTKHTISTSPAPASETTETAAASKTVWPAPASVQPGETSRRSHIEATENPPSMARVDLSDDDLPPKEFPAVHKASLYVGRGGLRCLVVRLVVLEKVFPSVHRRLVGAAAKRYSGWMGEAARRDEKLWNERLSSGSLKSLSSSFYRSFARGYYSGSLASLASDDSATSYTLAERKRLISSCGGGSSNILTFSDAGKESIRQYDPTVSVYPIPPSKSLGTTKKSIFDLSGRFRHMASCLTTGTLTTDRPGRTLLYPGANRRLMKPTPPPIVDEEICKSKVRGSHISPRTTVLVSMVPKSLRPPCTTGEATGQHYDDISVDLNSATRPVEWALATTLASRRHKGSQRQLNEPRQRGRKRGPFLSRKGKEDRMSSVLP